MGAPPKPASRVVPTDFLFREQWDFEIIQMPEAWFELLVARGENQQFGSSDLIIGVKSIWTVRRPTIRTLAAW